MQATNPSPAEIITAITESLASIPERLGLGKTDRDWTTQVKEAVGSVGEKYQWNVCASGSEFKGRFENEWLYDLIWFRNDPNTVADQHLSEVYLVLESELSFDANEIRYDFEKLLLAKATVKVMVFQGWESNISQLFELLEGGIRAFKKRSSDETYILAALNNNSLEFVVRQINGTSP